MQSASWFVSPEADSRDSQVPQERKTRQIRGRRPLPPPTVDDEQIATALDRMEAGEALGGALPERPARRTPTASGPTVHFDPAASTLPPHPASALAQVPVPRPESLRDDVPPEVAEPTAVVAEAPELDLDSTDPGLPGFAEKIAHLPVPVPEREPEAAAEPEEAVLDLPEAAIVAEAEAGPDLSTLPSDVIPPQFRIEPTFEPARGPAESPYDSPIAPPRAERPSRFLDLEHSEPPASTESLETAWFADLGAAGPESGEAGEPEASAPDTPAWALDREASLADTVVRPSAELPDLPVPTPEAPELSVDAAAGFATEAEADEPLAAWVDEAVARSDDASAPSLHSDIRTTNPMIDVFRRSAVLENGRPATDPNDSALGVAEIPVPTPETAPRKVVRARVASIGSRALAWLVDGVILCSTTAGLGYAAAQVAGSELGPLSVLRDPLVAAGLLGLTAVVGAVYATVGALVGGQTFGARLARVRVLDRSGRCPGLKRSLLRGVTASIGTVFFLVGLVWVVVDDRGQALHDKIAQTYVVRT